MFGLPYSYHPSLTFHGLATSFQLIWLDPHSQFPSLMTQNFEVFVLFCFIINFFFWLNTLDKNYYGTQFLYLQITKTESHSNIN